MSDSVRPHRRQPIRLHRPWDSPGKNTGVGCHFLLRCMKVKSESEVTQSCPTLSDPMNCSLPGSSIHGIFQARVLEWGAIAFSEISSLSHSIVFLYFFALIAQEGFLISSCYLELCIQMLYLSFSPLLFASLLYTVICKASSESQYDLLHFFSRGMVLLPVSCTMSRTSANCSSGSLSDLVP